MEYGRYIIHVGNMEEVFPYMYLQSENFFVTFGRVGSSWFGMFQVPFYSNLIPRQKKKREGKKKKDRVPAGYGMAW